MNSLNLVKDSVLVSYLSKFVFEHQVEGCIQIIKNAIAVLSVLKLAFGTLRVQNMFLETINNFTYSLLTTAHGVTFEHSEVGIKVTLA